MPKSPGRNSYLENLWRAFTGSGAREANVVTGQTAPTATLRAEGSSWRNSYRSEYTEIPIRDPSTASDLIAGRNHPELSSAINLIVRDCFTSEVGDVQGFRVAATLADGSAIDPETEQIASAVIQRVLMRRENLNLIVEEALSYGDSFRAIVFDPGITQITKLKRLPTWEMFRIEDLNGNVTGFEQRRLVGSDAAEFKIHPLVCVHWRNNQKAIYGRALFLSAIESGEVDRLDRAISRLEQAAGAIAFSPTLHELPEGWSHEQCEAYQLSIQNQRRNLRQIVTDYYMEHGGKVSKIGTNAGSSLSDLIADVQLCRSRIAMIAQLPPWMLNLPAQGAIDISGQPAMGHARLIGDVRSMFAEGARQIIDLELILNAIPEERRQYQLEFPKIHTNTVQQSIASTTDMGQEDQESTTPPEE